MKEIPIEIDQLITEKALISTLRSKNSEHFRRLKEIDKEIEALVQTNVQALTP